MNFESNFKKVIPYCSENFITIPLWEEGNYCWQMNLWQIFKNKSEISIPFEDYLDFLKHDLDEILEELSEKYPKFCIEYYIANQRFVDSLVGVAFDFTIRQSDFDDILESNFEYNYNIEEYMEVAVALLEKLKINRIF